jgi:L-2,4-diaminobutyrate decarboxylase
MATLQVLGGIEEFEPLVRLAHADTLWAAGARGAARGAIRVAKARIEQLAADLVPADRPGFLYQVPHNREIVDRATQWLRTEAPPGAAPVSVAAAHDPEAFRAQGHRLVDRLADYLTAATGGQLPVVDWHDPDAMRARWPAGYPAEPDGDVEALAARLLADSVHQHHPRTAAHQVSAPWPAAVLADMVASLLNNGMAAYDSGPASSAIEAEVLAWLAGQLGLPPGSDGLLTSGGSLGNLTALVVARNERGGGAPGERLAVLCGDQTHYSVRRAVRVMGWGDDGAVPVASDGAYRMRPDAIDDALARARAAGRTVIGLVASTGSTATGAIDPIAAIADACSARGLWLHIDGAHGASACLSDRYRDLISGIDRADSVVWDAHKLLHTPALITAVLFRDGGAAVRALATDAPYLDEGGEPGWWDRGLRTLECTKRMMSVVLHATLSLVGTRAIADAVTVGFDRARRLATLLREHGDFELATEPDTNIVVFRYTPADDEGQERIRHRLRTDGTFLIGRVRLAGKLWLRTTIMNPLTTDADLAALVSSIVCVSS